MRHRTPRQPTSIMLDEGLKVALETEAARQRRSRAELIDFILYDWVRRNVKKTRKPRAKKIEEASQ